MAVTLDTYALVTLDDAKDHLNIPASNTDFDDKVKRFINSATYDIENFIDRKVIKRSYTEYQDGRGSNKILLKQWPATKPTELWIDPSSEFTDTTNQLATTDYQIDNDSLVVLIFRQFSKGTRNIKVTYEAGWDTVPWPIQVACLWLVEFEYDISNDRRVGNTKKGKNQEDTEYHDDWPMWLQRKLLPYKRCEWPIANSPVANT